MSSESELREAMRSSASNLPTSLDADAVVRRARARRVPKLVALTSLSVLAIAGIATLGVTVLPALQPGLGGASSSSVMATAPESLQDGGADNSASKSFDAHQITQNLCGSPTGNTPPNSAGLTLSVNFPSSSAVDGQNIAGTVSLTNTGTSSVSGSTTIAPTVFLSSDGITVWHSNGAMIAMAVDVDLKPGQSFTYDAYFTPVECGPEDDANGLFSDNLPALTAGQYSISAELVFVPRDAEYGQNILVGGPAQTIELR